MEVVGVSLQSFEVNSPQHKAWLLKRQKLLDVAKELEGLIIKLAGEKSEHLFSVYKTIADCDFQAQQFEKGIMQYEKIARLIESNYGQVSEAYLQSFSEYV